MSISPVQQPMKEETEITDYPGKRYSSIRVPQKNFIGIIDWSPDRSFGLAVGSQGGSQCKIAIFFNQGKAEWTTPVNDALDIRISNQGIGIFVDGNRLRAFGRNGPLFNVPCPGRCVVKDIRVNDKGIALKLDRGFLVFNMAGDLLAQSNQPAEDELTDPNGDISLRWDRFRSAEQWFDSTQHGNSEAAERAQRLYQICIAQFEEYPRQIAICHRRLGQLALLAGEKIDAAKHWRKALDIDPKVGIKKEFTKLTREIEKS